MSNPTPALLPSEPDPAILAKMGQVEHACLTVLLLGVAANVAGWLVPALERMFHRGWEPMSAEAVLAVVLCALSLILSETDRPRWTERLSLLLTVAVGLLAGADLIKQRFDLQAGTEMWLLSSSGSPVQGRMSAQAAVGFGLLSCSMILLRAQRRAVVRVADLLAFMTIAVVLTLVMGHIFGTLPAFGISTHVPTSPQTLFCLFLLLAVVVLRRARNGIFSIFTGRGIGARLSRNLLPILLFLPFFREVSRAFFLGEGKMPTHYVTAFLAAMASTILLALMLYLAWRINGMEAEIQYLTLRDELTGLYNLRGFQLLAEQALRLAQRSELPFSVLYIDLDNLKQINDSLGHQAGSEFLVETSVILRANFRETDVLGRIGGDEFAVAGQFSHAAIASATERLEACCAGKNAEADRRYALSFSVGHVTSLATDRETLDELLTKADHAMYRVKQSKKDGNPQSGSRLGRGEQGPRPA